MVEDSKEKTGTDNSKEVEKLIGEIGENAEIFHSFLNMAKRLKDAGIIDFMDSISKDYMPTDIEFLGKFFTSREFTTSVIKGGNTATALLYMLLSERNTDLIRLLLYNSEGFSDAVVDGVRNSRKMTFLTLYSMMKDPDVSAGMTAMFNILKVFGRIVNEKMP
ncbi:MAG: helical membrane plugin domain-containing protein [Thermoplasmataceae archaeon]